METNPVKEEVPKVQSNVSTPKYKVIDIDSVFNGKCCAGDTDIAINGVVARVVIDRCNFDDFLTNKKKPPPIQDSKIKGKKRKLQDIKAEELSDDANKSGLEPKKKRGRPKKLIQINPKDSESSDESDTESVQSIEVRKRGRPRKSFTFEKREKVGNKSQDETKSKQLNVSSGNLSTEYRRFNGGSTSFDVGRVSTSRIRKPNSRLQDFIVSSNARYYEESPPINKSMKEVTTTPKEKVKSMKEVTAMPKEKVKSMKEVTATPKEKVMKKVIKDSVDDPLKISSDDDIISKSTTTDSLNTSRSSDEVVRSFLPVFDDPLQFDDVEEQTIKPKKVFKEKENQVNNLQAKFSKNNVSKPKAVKSDQSDYSPPKLRSGDDSKGRISTPDPQKNVAKNITLPRQKQSAVNNNAVSQQKTQNLKVDVNSLVTKLHAIVNKVTSSPIKTASSPTKTASSSSKTTSSSFKTTSGSLKPTSSLSKATSSPFKTTSSSSKTTSSSSKTTSSSFKPTSSPSKATSSPFKATNSSTKATSSSSKTETKMNGTNSVAKQHKTNAKYILVDNDGVRSRNNKSPKVGDVDFNKLVRSLKLVKLPAANWKIRIVVSKQQTITEVTFTNKEVNERCIKFSRTIAGYVITFGKVVVNLLGAPTKISSFNDVSILLDIIHNISATDPVLEYGTSSNA